MGTGAGGSQACGKEMDDVRGQGQEEIRVERPSHGGSEVLACYPEAQGRSERKAFPRDTGDMFKPGPGEHGRGSPKLARGW